MSCSACDPGLCTSNTSRTGGQQNDLGTHWPPEVVLLSDCRTVPLSYCLAVLLLYFSEAMHSISRRGPLLTNAATTTVDRAGGSFGKNVEYTEFIP